MKFIDGFRDPKAARALVGRLKTLGRQLGEADRRATFMEVCGSHTMAVARYAIRQVLPDTISLVSGPGCPVCVTPPGYIDAAIELAQRGVVIVTFGDMLKVPGSDSSLEEARSDGGDIRVVYTPTAAVESAANEPERNFVFLAIGFETTVAPVASIVKIAAEYSAANISLLTAFKTIPPVLDALITDSELNIDGLLCPAHVSAIIGAEAYRPYADEHSIPCVIAGFEPLDILMGLEGLSRQVLEGRSEVENQYARVVTQYGNRLAQEVIQRYLEPEDAVWRGLGTIPSSGLILRAEYQAYDAAKRFDVQVGLGHEKPGCLCGEVVKGKRLPDACPLYASVCRPESPVGPCMVSAEGTCAAYFKYSRLK